MADFEKAINKIQKFEGGYSTDKNDAGNYYPQTLKGTFIGSNMGITPTAYKEFFGVVPTVSQMKSLTKEQAKAIYKKNYWDKIGGDKINNQSIAEILFDSAVNQGVPTAIKGIKKVLGIGDSSPSMDNDTIRKINFSPQKKLFEDFKQWRIEAYASTKKPYVQAWIDRVNKYKFEIGIGAIVIFVSILISVVYLGYKNKSTIEKIVK
jgi:lysozyme family protein